MGDEIPFGQKCQRQRCFGEDEYDTKASPQRQLVGEVHGYMMGWRFANPVEAKEEDWHQSYRSPAPNVEARNNPLVVFVHSLAVYDVYRRGRRLEKPSGKEIMGNTQQEFT